MNTPTPMNEINPQSQKLIAIWRQRARRKFQDARLETNPVGRRLIEHGAVCYANCATELENAIRVHLRSSAVKINPSSQGTK